MPMTDYMKGLVGSNLANTKIALFTTAPTSVGNDGVEVTGGSYARGSTAFVVNVGDPGLYTNNSALSFTNMPECDVVAVGVYNNAGTQLLYWDNLDTAKHFDAGDNGTIASGSFSILINSGA